VLDRYLAGTATVDERARVERWWRATSVDERVSTALHAQAPGAQDIAQTWDQIRTKALVTPTRSPTISDHHGHGRPHVDHREAGVATSPIASPKRTRTRVAPTSRVLPRTLPRVLLGALIVGVIGFVVGVTRKHPQSTVPIRTYATTVAQQGTVTLPDGSRAVLGPATTLSVQTGASGGTLVTLVGQALFTVAHHAGASFVVRVNRTEARVLGTTFFVREYATDRASRVAVVDGRVSVSDEREAHGHTQTVLTRGGVAVVTDSGPMLVTPVTATDEYTAWTSGRLIFRDTPVSDIVAELSRTYGVDIRVADSVLARRTMTWSVLVNRRSLSGVLDVLSVTLDAHFVRSGHTITIIPGRRASQKVSTPPPFSQEPQYGR
jgi:transmembrane sensor